MTRTDLRTALDRVMERLGLGSGDLRARHLLLLRRVAPGGSRFADLARETRLTDHAVRRLAGELEHLGLVERRPGPDDRRVTLVHLTPAGRARRASAGRILRRIAAEWARDLGAERLAALRQLVLSAQELRGGRGRGEATGRDRRAGDARATAAGDLTPPEEVAADGGEGDGRRKGAGEARPGSSPSAVDGQAEARPRSSPPAVDGQAEARSAAAAAPVEWPPRSAVEWPPRSPVAPPAAAGASPGHGRSDGPRQRLVAAIGSRGPAFLVAVLLMVIVASLGAINQAPAVPAPLAIHDAPHRSPLSSPTPYPLPLGEVPPANGPIAADPRHLLGPGPVVALTFDDGPDPRFTPAVLAILSRYGAVGTFFMVGREAAARPDLVAAVMAEGSVVGNHTWNHTSLPGLPDGRFDDEVDRTDELLGRLTGEPVRCVRPPYGRVDALLAQRLQPRGLQLALWNIDPSDYTRPPAQVIFQRVERDLRPGAVIAMHDGGGDRSQTIAALPLILESIRAHGLLTAPVCGPT